MKRNLRILAVAVVALSMLLASCSVPAARDPAKSLKAGSIQHFAAYASIVKLLKQSGAHGPYYMRNTMGGAPEMAQDSKSGNDYSTTNVQVAGVDEADIVKTDGSYLYLLTNGRLIVVDARDPKAMKVVASVVYVGENTTDYPMEMYLDIENHRLSVLLNSYRQLPQPTVTIGPEPTREPEPSKPEEPPVTTVEPEPTGTAVTGEVPPDATAAVEPSDQTAADQAIAPDSKMIARPGIWWGGMGTTKVIVYDIVDPTNPTRVRTFEQEGSYLSSRRIGSALYIVTNRYTWYDETATVESMIPSTRTGSSEKDWTTLAANDIGIIKANDYSSFLVVSGLDTVDTGREADSKALLGAGNILYASTGYLYVAVARWEQQDVTGGVADTAVDGVRESTSSGTAGTSTSGESPDASGEKDDPALGTETPTKAPDTKEGEIISAVDPKPVFEIMPMPVVKSFTDIFRFRIADAKVTEDGAGTVPGYILNQYAMDESDGYFRVATTVGDAWRNDQYTSMNNLYVLDGGMKTVGKLEGLASRETIKSVRFIGDKAYLVTFRTVDPLFVIDLSVPTKPAVLGELKIPGYSEYLHPFDENLLLGFGKDAVEVGEMGYYLGFKFSMFDIANQTAPRELANLIVGDRGTYSEIAYNPKVLLFSKEKNLIGIPILINRVPDDQKQDPIAYGQPVYQGFLVVSYDAAGRFIVRGVVSHSNKTLDYTQDFQSYEAINGMADPEALYGARTVQRGLFIGDTLFTVSSGFVKASSLSDLSTLGTVELPGAQQFYGKDLPVREGTVE